MRRGSGSCPKANRSNFNASKHWLAAGQSLTDTDLICTKDFGEGVNVIDGPSCTVDADCTNGRAADLSGCTP